MQRKNRRPVSANCSNDQMGVDLNRNFGYQWGVSGVEWDPCSCIYPGLEPFSEPESRAVRDFILGHLAGRVKVFLDVHSYGQWFLYPWVSHKGLV